ncbi:amino acid ABC transporter permease/ATP-binding protein CydD [Hyphomonas adhaerens MHS-3]|uniref:Amino acid ABC transporter permease/ATP-binding protein CydD n=3 Tax=Hyphomonas adhaerens TaxID=81029 RepID=A0A069E7M2_9PROT|nr:thiol reductant ABC exporter subunit CydD [Hyphomonas adhaerens]KCZ85979.1 amino acid ABC transporter permease/ATP-binding protein CydD [Hyphomonas adhaerens MHS-3]
MPEDTENSEKKRTRSALRLWAGASQRAVSLGLACQILAMAGWIAIAWGIGHSVAAIAAGQPAGPGLPVAAAGVLVRGISGWLGDLLLARAGQTMVNAARAEIFETLSKAGAGWLGGADAGTRTAQIIDRTAKLEGYAARWLPGMRLAVTGPVIILIAVATQSWLSAVLLLVSVMVLPVFIWLTASETAARAKAQQAALDDLSGAFQSRAAQSGLIRAFRGIRRETASLEDAALQLRDRTMAILRVAFLSTAVLEFFASVSIALVAVYIGFKLLGVFPFGTGETLTLAEGLTALILAPEFFSPIRKLSSLHHDRADAAAAASMLSDWLAHRSDFPVTKRPPLESAPVITFDQTALGWGDGKTAVSDLTFKALPGKVTTLAGPSGSGKSTALLALIGRARLTGGEIRVDAHTLQPGESLADSIAYIGQTPWLMEGTIRENIAIARPDAGPDEIKDAARQAGILDFADEGRGGLEQDLARFGAGLSGGQRQRIALARALLRNAPILLLDEPTAHLDPDAEEDFLRKLKDLATDRTLLVASHSDTLIAASDEVIWLQPQLMPEDSGC